MDKGSSKEGLPPGVQALAVDYKDKEGLVETLRGSHTVVSFIQLLSDPGQESQKNLIDACIAAGVKRFAPSEYGSALTVDMPWWAGKEEIRRYLKKVNQGGMVRAPSCVLRPQLDVG
jgi:saccharopine dehydrogenase-like NADP-dependent oxidoreductase